MRSWPVGGAGYLRDGMSASWERSTSVGGGGGRGSMETMEAIMCGSPRKEVGDKGRRDLDSGVEGRRVAVESRLRGALCSLERVVEALGVGDGDGSETGRR
jgi:hypothetical protein